MTSDDEALRQQLALSRWSWRFQRPETEADYLTWHARQVIPLTRITYVATIVLAFPATVISTWAAAPQYLGAVTAWVLLVLAPIAVGGLIYSYRAGFVRWVGPINAFSNCFIGGSIVFLVFYPIHRPDMATMAALASVFFAFGLRMRPGLALAAALPYLVLDEILVARMSPASLVAYSCVNTVVLGGGLIIAWTLDRTSRESFRQERIIEAQQKQIERERDRADSLLYNVLPAAIADRLKKDPARIAEHFDQVTCCSATSPASRRSPPRSRRRISSPRSTRCSPPSTTSPSATGWRRSRRSATPTWPSAACPRLGRTTRRPSPGWRWRCAISWRRSASSGRVNCECGSGSTPDPPSPA
jgi:hypothetical protein